MGGSNPGEEHTAATKPSDTDADVPVPSEPVEPKSVADSKPIPVAEGIPILAATPTPDAAVEGRPIEVGESNESSIPEPEIPDAKSQEAPDLDTVSVHNIDPRPDSQDLLGGDDANEEVPAANESLELDENDSGDSPRHGEEYIDALETFESRVLLRDQNGCTIPPMKFLTDRLLALMEQPENEK